MLLVLIFTHFSIIKIIFLILKGDYKLLCLQLAKLAGNTVVATCGGEEKAMLLKKLGVDRVIDYRAEDIKTVCLFSQFSFLYLVGSEAL